jgi:hypothetical protein
MGHSVSKLLGQINKQWFLGTVFCVSLLRLTLFFCENYTQGNYGPAVQLLETRFSY